VLLDTPEHALENIAHLAGLQRPETRPDKLAARLVPGAVEHHRVEMWVEPQIGRRPLHHGDRAGLPDAPTLLRRALGVKAGTVSTKMRVSRPSHAPSCASRRLHENGNVNTHWQANIFVELEQETATEAPVSLGRSSRSTPPANTARDATSILSRTSPGRPIRR